MNIPYTIKLINDCERTALHGDESVNFAEEAFLMLERALDRLHGGRHRIDRKTLDVSVMKRNREWPRGRLDRKMFIVEKRAA